MPLPARTTLTPEQRQKIIDCVFRARRALCFANKELVALVEKHLSADHHDTWLPSLDKRRVTIVHQDFEKAKAYILTIFVLKSSHYRAQLWRFFAIAT